MAIPGVALGQDISSAWGNQVAEAINNLVPRGTVWMGYYAAEPDGWAFMDGREVSRTDGEWAPLYADIGAYCGPGNGVTTWNLPLAADRFPAGIGATVGGLGGTGGWKDAVVVQHSHQINNHVHSTGDQNQTHYHSLEAHAHAPSANAGWHEHAAGGTGGDKGFRFFITWGSATNEKVAGGGTPGVIGNMVPTDIEGDGDHGHGNTGGWINAGGWQGANQGHNHGNTGNPSDRGTDNGSGNVVGTNRNMPPWLALAFIVKK